MPPPPKAKPIEDYTPDDHFRAMRGEQIESSEYVADRDDALRAAGLHDEAAAVMGDPLAAKPIEQWSPADHAEHMRRSLRDEATLRT